MRVLSVIRYLLVVSTLLATTRAYTYPDCKNGPLAQVAICDQNADIDDRAASFLAQLNITEKISRLYSGFGAPSPAIPRLGIPELQWINDALHGLTCCSNFQYLDGDVAYNSSSSFPSPINFGATFDDDLAFGLGHWTGVEARAFTNAGRGGVDLWSPNINPFRDPRWGRGQEVPGEDPYTIGRYAYNYVLGMQRGEDPRYYLAVADCKHYAAYDLENWHGEQRYAFSANVSQKELIEYFLVPFESCIRDAQAGSIMCSYNALNGVPTCADDFLIQTVARELWGFDKLDDGWVVSDCDAVGNIWDPHHYTKTPEEAAAVALLAGTDNDCGDFYRSYLPGAYEKGLVSESDFDVSILRLTKSLIRIGYFDDPATQPYRQYGIEHVNTKAAALVSYTAAVESLTLVKNTASVLPWKSGGGLKVAVIGPLVTDTYFIQGNYRGKPPYVTTLLDALNAESGITVQYVQGCEVNSQNTTGFDAAVAAAGQADVVVYMGGLTEAEESEGHDRDVLTWPGVQQQLIAKLGQAAKKPITVLVMGGGQVDLSTELQADTVGAIVWVGYPSQHGGKAIADVLFGRFSPSGRLVTTSYPASYTQLSMEDMELRPNAQTGNPGRTYLWYTGKPVLPFGYGLSYTTFDYAWQDTAKEVEHIADWAKSTRAWAADKGVADHSNAPFIMYSANVTNTGSMTSDVSVLLFVQSSAPDTPKQQLSGYVHVHALQPQQSKVVYFDVRLSSLLQVDHEGDRYLQPAEYTVFIGHAGHREILHTFTLAGERTLIQQWPRRNERQLEQAKQMKEQHRHSREQ